MKLKNCQLIFSLLIPILLFTSCVTKDRAGLPCLGALEANDPYEAQGIAGVLLNGQENSIIELITGATNDRKGIAQECGGIALGVSSNAAGQTASGETSSGTGIVFPNSTYNFTLGVQITRVTPTLSGTVTNCRTNPALPSGVQIDPTTCALFGNPSVSLSPTQFEILADSSSGTVFRTNLTISVGRAATTVGSGTGSSGGGSNAVSFATYVPFRIAFNNGVFVIISQGSRGYMRSTDGVSWTFVSGANSQGICTGNGLFLVVTNGSVENFEYSSDGLTWNEIRNLPSQTYDSCAFGNGIWIAGVSNGFAIGSDYLTSTNLSSWLPRAVSGRQLVGLSFGNGVFVAGGGSGLRRTTDGINWTTVTINPLAASASPTIFGNNEFILLLNENLGGIVSNRIFRSTADGLTWNAENTNDSGNYQAIAYGNGTYVAVGQNRVYRSTDGVNWTASIPPQANTWSGVAYGNGVFVAVCGTGTNKVMTSPDGLTWTLR